MLQLLRDQIQAFGPNSQVRAKRLAVARGTPLPVLERDLPATSRRSERARHSPAWLFDRAALAAQAREHGLRTDPEGLAEVAEAGADPASARRSATRRRVDWVGTPTCAGSGVAAMRDGRRSGSLGRIRLVDVHARAPHPRLPVTHAVSCSGTRNLRGARRAGNARLLIDGSGLGSADRKPMDMEQERYSVGTTTSRSTP